MRKLTTKEFIEKAKIVHGDKYDYSKTVYTSSRDKVCIICPIHGEFWQKANEHLRGHGCDKCGGTYRLDTDEFIRRAKLVHGNKYDYSKTVYVNSNTKVCIICKEHGEFWQMPHAHLGGSGCPKCHGVCNTTEDFIYNAKKVHGDKYDYSKVEYIDSVTPVCIICKEHGEFWQKPVKHLIGHGCNKCGLESRKEKQFLTQDEFIEKAKKVHGDKYDYSKVVYKTMRDKVCIICPKHGEFWQFPFDHINEHGCPKCGQLISKGEDEIYNFISKYFKNEDILRNDREILDGREIDILLPNEKIGIEYNGLKWHSEEFNKDFRYHLSKTEDAFKKGIELIQIFEDEYINHKDIVLNKIQHILNIDNEKEKVMARKCHVKEIDKNLSKVFLNKYHIQGYGKCTKSYGCFYYNNLIGVMSFLNENNGKWQLVRFATDYNYLCQGVGGKLFKHFVYDNQPNVIKTFADRRWTITENNNLYTKLGFKLDKIIKPDYRYVDISKPTERVHKANLRKYSIHKKYGLPMKMTEKEMTEKIGLSKIWDCGLYRYIWKMGD